ncbi:MAG: alpha/beta hydrolase [Lachnospiraceae bacterium]
MGRKYEISLLDKMKQGEQEICFQEVPVLVKPIPEGGNPGDMDPRLYKSMKLLPLMKHFMPKPKKDATVLEQILPLRKMFGEYKGDYIADQGVAVQHIQVESFDGYLVPVRVYKRENAGEHLPVMVYYHGGGFFGGGPDIVEQMCKLLVQNLDCVVLNVDYRLCPEAHYPQPFEDCWHVLKWIHDNAEQFGGNPQRIAVSGDSAGGNLAAAVTLRDREESTGMVKLQVLLYPAVNISGKETEFYKGVDSSKYQKSKKHARVLNAVFEMMSGMMGSGEENMLDAVYLQGNLPMDHIYASPLLDDMHDLPSTMLIFGEHDFLAFEDFAYARTLHKAGIPLKTVVYRGLGHGFADQIGVMPQAEDCMREIAAMMKATL